VHLELASMDFVILAMAQTQQVFVIKILAPWMMTAFQTLAFLVHAGLAT